MKWTQILPWVSAGVVVGLGVYTFQYAEGISYLSNDPKACINCHVMRENYLSWRKGPHREAAACNDCHVPHGFPAKWIAKAQNGWNHSVEFTFQSYKKPIRIKPHNQRLVRDNCVRCHGAQLAGMPDHPVRPADDVSCTDCHTGIGHAE